jgi:aryl-alcohol dehydrogenase-like predicted oxidoreductase
MSGNERRRLGSTDMEITTLSYGAMELRGAPRGPELSESDAEHLLNGILDAGINYLDTSIDYGMSEERIGRYLSGRRSEYYLASKCGCNIDGDGGHLHTAENIRNGVENSLRRCRTDYLDLVQFHRSLAPEEFDAEGGLSELIAMRDEGKVRYLGVSGTLPNLDGQLAMGVFDVFQIPYSALQREHEQVISRVAAAGAGTVIRGGAARGAPTDWESRTYYMMPGSTMRDIWDAAALDELLEGMTRIEFTLRFTLSHPDLHTTIVGTSSLEHLRSNLETAAKGPLPADLLAEAKRRLAAAGSDSAD